MKSYKEMMWKVGNILTLFLDQMMIIVWSELAADIIKRSGNSQDAKAILGSLGCFAGVSIIMYLLIWWIKNKLNSFFEKRYTEIQYRFIHENLAECGLSKNFSELEVINRVTDDLRQTFEWRMKTKAERNFSVFLGLCLFGGLVTETHSLIVILYGIILLNIMIPILFDKYYTKDYREVMEAYDKWAKRLQEVIDNFSTIKHLKAEKQITQLYQKEVMGHVAVNRTANKTFYLEKGLKTGMSQFSAYASYLVIGLYLLYGRIDFSTVAKVVLLLPLIQNLTSTFVTQYSQKRKVLVSDQRIKEMFLKRAELEHNPSGYEIAVEHVTFGYEQKEELFSDLNLSIKEGEKLIIVGENGSGKSSFIRLLTGLYPANKGDIFIGGVKVQKIPLNWLQNHIFYMAQENFVIPGSVLENLNLRNIDADLFEKAFLQQDIAELSEGQKKQIMLEELFKTPKEIVILDEPENHLDVSGREKLKEFLKQTEKTVIVISHTGEFADMADRILKIGKGGENK